MAHGRSASFSLIRTLFAFGLAAAGLAVGGTAQAGSDVCYKGGPTLANFKLNGTATLNGSSIVLTADQGNQGGSAMFQNKFSSASDFHIKMLVKISTTSSSTPADGMAFVMHNDPAGTSALGALGGGVGYQGITNSVVVEFDTYQNGGDPAGPHIAVTKQGVANHTSPPNNTLPSPVLFSSLSPPMTPTNGTPFYIWIDYSATAHVVSVYVSNSNSKPATAAFAPSLNLATELGSSFYIGFTGSTGGAWDKHEFLELYATDTLATAEGSCCSTDADCVGSTYGATCDTGKHACGNCIFSDTSSCSTGNTGCDLTASHNACVVPCDGNFSGSTAHKCTSATLPACRTSGVGAGSCGACNGDYTSGSTYACAVSAPYCTTNGFCGLCTTNADCTTAGVTHTGAFCNATSGKCVSTCTVDSDCGSLNACVSGSCVAKAANGAAIPGGTCSVSTGSRFCTSGVCNTADNTCGYGNGAGSTCTAGNAATVCQSGTCSTAGVCIPATSGSCYADSECTSGFFCKRNTFACTAKLASGTAISNDGLHNGTCTAPNATAVCTSAACNATTNTCAVANGTACTANNGCVNNLCGSNGFCGATSGQSGCTSGTAATYCQSATCSASGVCVPAGGLGCFADSDCAAGKYCNRNSLTCTNKLNTGVAIPNDGLHNGTCSVPTATAVCTSGLCNSTTNTCSVALGTTCTGSGDCTSNICGSNSKCGYPDGGGTCTAGTAATVCQSASCSPNGGVCIPSGSGHCYVDPDCLNTQYCNQSTLTCVAKTVNSAAIPGGVCTAPLGARYCASGVCNTANNTCGYGNGAGSVCTAGTAASVCQSGACSTAGVCIPAASGSCYVDGECTSGFFCKRSTLTCTAKLGAGVAISNDGLHDGTCSAGNATAVCTSAACNGTTNTCGLANGATCTAANACVNNLCGGNGKCGAANGQSGCTVGTASAYCQSATCTSGGVCVPSGGSGCYVDTDCGSGLFCNRNTLTCTAKLNPGLAIPNDGLHNGTCSAPVASAVCVSAQCNATTNTCAAPLGSPCTADNACVINLCGGNGNCGYPDGGGTCSAVNASTVCQSGACSTALVCIPAGADHCFVDPDCASGQYCNQATLSCVAKLAAGTPIPTDALHDGTCAAASAVCSTGLCNADNKTCAGTQGAACTATNQCVDGICGSNGQCGIANGEGPCSVATAGTVCQSGVCSPSGGLCIPAASGSCAIDGDCAANQFCDPTALACVSKLAAGTPLPNERLHNGVCSDGLAQAVCSDGACNAATNTCGRPAGAGCQAAAECVANVCNAQGVCGYAAGTGTCTAGTGATVCASGVCSTSAGVCLGGTTGACFVDADCASGTFCDRGTLACVTQLAPGVAIPSDGLHDGFCTTINATAVCASGTCNEATNTCGAPVGGTCTVTAECTNGVCGSNGKCGYTDGSGSCTNGNATSLCQSGVCGVQSGRCAPAAVDGCATDADCATGTYCDGSSLRCVTKLDSGAPLPSDGPHATCVDGQNTSCTTGLCNATTTTCAAPTSGTCTAAKDCAQNVCGRNGKCGLDDGQTGCTTGTAALCQSGVCTASGVCGSLGCTTDAECPDSARCDATVGLCKAKLAAGEPLPVDSLHDGTCTTAAGTALCVTGVCNATTKTCALPTGQACTAGSACATNSCGSNGQCGLADGQSGCTVATATLCQSGICSATGNRCVPVGAGRCAVDGDCAAGTYCNGSTLTCVAQLGAGVAIPKDGLHDAGCLPGVATAVCASGLCNASADTCAATNGGACTTAGQCASNRCGSNGKCGVADGAGPCAVTTQASDCQSGLCNAAALLCQPAGAGRCVRDGDCAAAEYCNTTTLTCTAKLTPGSPLPNDGVHTGACDLPAAQALCGSGMCNATTVTCATTNGGACAAAQDCVSNICATDGKCGDLDGAACSSASTCRTGLCTAGVCGSGSAPVPPVAKPTTIGGGGGCAFSPGADNTPTGSLSLAFVTLGFILVRRRRR